MKKIDKINTLATKFEKADKPTTYNSSNYPYYVDVFLALLYCQQGLCAYSEKRLLDMPQDDIAKLFKNGEVVKNGKKKEKPAVIFGDIEHFNSVLKKENGWDWDNLFIALDSINQKVKKLEEPILQKKCMEKKWDFKEVMELLKPDMPDYQWDTYLYYDSEEHEFRAKDELDDVLVDKIESILLVLGINCAPIKRERIVQVERWLSELKEGKTPQVDEFPTAFEFCKRILNI